MKAFSVKLVFILVAVTALLMACTKEEKYSELDKSTGVRFVETKLFTLSDGCTVHKLESDKLYYTVTRIICPNGNGMLSHSCGKSCFQDTSMTAKPPEPTIEEKRAAVLSKLTLEDRRILGLKAETETAPSN